MHYLIGFKKQSKIRLGTFNQELAEKEWVMRPYMNTSRKSKTL